MKKHLLAIGLLFLLIATGSLQTAFPQPTFFNLFNLTGQMVLQQMLTDKTNQISVSAFSKGLYLYRIISPGRQLTSGKLAIE